MKRFDVVEIVAQPSNQFVQLTGAVCILVDDPQDGYANVAQLTLEGYTNAEGTLPLDCMKLCERGVWKAAAQIYRQFVIEAEMASDEFFKKRRKNTKKRIKAIKELSEQFKLSEDDIKFIYKKIKEV